jgi:hypothetical protein
MKLGFQIMGWWQEEAMVSQLAREIGHVPEQYDHGNRSTACLLEEAGFPDARGKVQVDEVEDVLRREPYLIDLWLRRSRDQRYAGGWGIEHAGDDYRVRSFADKTVLGWKDRTRACAEFVARYVQFIGEVQARSR